MIFCQHCGDSIHTEETLFDSGTTLKCESCSQETIVDLFKPDERKALYDAKDEVERLKSGKFTPEEWNNLCHETDKPMTLEQFDVCCKEYQEKLYGGAAVEKHREKLEQTKARDYYAALCKLNLKLKAIQGDLDNYLNQEAANYVGEKLKV